MRLDRLTTFAQAARAASPENISRVLSARDNALRAAWSATGTRELFTAGSAGFRFPAIRNRYAAVLAFLKSRELAEHVARLAKITPPRVVVGMRVDYAVVWRADYLSQTDPEKYARCKAEILAAQCRANGVPADVVKVDAIPGAIRVYRVEAHTDAAGLVQLNYRPDLPLREFVRLSWSFGCQPRVFNPWIPVGFEEQNGLDYFGGEVKR
jgi:hypothetical protein